MLCCVHEVAFLRKIEEGHHLFRLNIAVKHDLWQGYSKFLLLNKSDDSDVVLFGGEKSTLIQFGFWSE
jgi:hypothetical protein